jgi:hypothetical protein
MVSSTFQSGPTQAALRPLVSWALQNRRRGPGASRRGPGAAQARPVYLRMTKASMSTRGCPAVPTGTTFTLWAPFAAQLRLKTTWRALVVLE